MPDSSDRHRRTQAQLVEFLDADLNLGFTLLATAYIEVGVDQQHYESVVSKVRTAIKTIRELALRVEDKDTLLRICERADTLEAGLAGLQSS